MKNLVRSFGMLVLVACSDAEQQRPGIQPNLTSTPRDCLGASTSCMSDDALTASVSAAGGNVFVGVAPEGFPHRNRALRTGQRPKWSPEEWEAVIQSLQAQGLEVNAAYRELSMVLGQVPPSRVPLLRRLPFVWYISPAATFDRRKPATLQTAPVPDPIEPDTGDDESPAQTRDEPFDNLNATQLVPWQLEKVGVPLARTENLKGQGRVVGIIDGEVDIFHPDLSGRLLEQRNFTSDQFGNPDAHATMVAGLILANDNSIGTVGIAPEAQYVNAKVCVGSQCFSQSLFNAIVALAQIPAVSVINISLGWPGAGERCPIFWYDAMQYAIRRGKTIIVAGEEVGTPQVNDTYFGCYDFGPTVAAPDNPPGLWGLLAVSAVDRAGEPTTYSWYELAYASYGGEDFEGLIDSLPYTTFPVGMVEAPLCGDFNGDGYGPCYGTSAAAAIASGVVLLVHQRHWSTRMADSTGPADTENALGNFSSSFPCNLRQPCGSRSPAYHRYGTGIINIEQFILYLLPSPATQRMRASR